MKLGHIIPIIYTVALLAVPSIPQTASGQSSRCLAADSTSAMIIDWAKVAVSESDTTARSQWHLPNTVADSVLLVTDSATCANAVNAYDTDFPPTSRNASRRAHVIRIQDVYIVMDPSQRGDREWDIYKVLNSVYAVLAKIAN